MNKMSDSKPNPLSKIAELKKTLSSKTATTAGVEAEVINEIDTSNKDLKTTTNTAEAAAAVTNTEVADLQGATALPLASSIREIGNTDNRASIVLVNAANTGSGDAAQELGVILNMSANETETVNVSELGAKIYAVINNTPNTAVDNEIERSCWICFATDEDNRMAAWVQPCKCRGTTKWVHQSCLYRWIDEKQKGNALRSVSCQQCQTEYIIVFPHMGKFANILESFDNLVKRLSPFLAAGIIVGSLYWTAVTYGAVTFLQIVGHKKGLSIMENGDPLILLLGLPAIPVGLVLGRMIRWEDAIIRLIRNRRSVARKLPLMNFIIPYPEEEEEQTAQNPATPSLSDPVSATRVFCGALLLPTISCIVGRLLFESIDNSLHRTLLGGLTFITVKGILKIYLKQQQYSRKKKRRIIDYTDDNVRAYVHLSGNNNTRHFAAAGTAAAAAAAAAAAMPRPQVAEPEQPSPNVYEDNFMV